VTTRQRRVIAAIWSLIVVALLWMPMPAVEGPKLPLDKLAHAVVFAVLGGLWHTALRTRHRTSITVLAGLAFAALTEIVQGLLPWSRTPESADLVADAAGLLVGVVVAGRLWRNGRDSKPDP